MKIARLAYNFENDRIGVIDNMDLWLDSGLHCGETLEVFIDGEWKVDRIELNDQWNLVYSKLKGFELEGVKVRY